MCVCGGGGGGGIASMCVLQMKCVYDVLHFSFIYACTDLSNTELQTCIFCEKLFIRSQNPNGQWTCTATKVNHVKVM